MTETEKLQPCPFCNSEHTEMNAYSDDTWFFVQCNDCGATGPDGHDHCSAIRAWNQRAKYTSPPQSK
ncbi:Lar family restriction alleviation protein [Xenorhabdus bovienii]|nr:Lar family restriction alleviation protein [Xenorhabdus bovienii]MDE9484281.1 Lar family restriction alleviation protein [Xenorhabdus bovienii]MDE9545559.1 Lar family restriction alleviation protein [Xenorhabdus bovienii]MDE9557976.1 Lar family restriction alleviation protein [Xenorhabdus bovienii]MDE9566648.1 Lar family restriction alleviation protein [Xenorhabdus bovienii]